MPQLNSEIDANDDEEDESDDDDDADGEDKEAASTAFVSHTSPLCAFTSQRELN